MYTFACPLILLGGENIFPAEIEEQLLCLPTICEASVVGLSDERYGEVVSCFLRVSEGKQRPKVEDVKAWVNEKLGRHKVPAWVFWVGDADGCTITDYPKTGSGKHQKHLLKAIGDRALNIRVGQKPKIDRGRL